MSARRVEAGDAVVGRNIRVHRLAQRLSQSELARHLGVSYQQLQKYEQGLNRVGSARLMRIAPRGSTWGTLRSPRQELADRDANVICESVARGSKRAAVERRKARRLVARDASLRKEARLTCGAERRSTPSLPSEGEKEEGAARAPRQAGGAALAV